MTSDHPWRTTPAELQDRILKYMSIPQLAHLGTTSRHHYGLVKSHVRGRVNGVLSEYSLPHEMLAFMEREKIIISGSIALAVMEPECVMPNDMDIFIPAGSLQVVEDFLQKHTRYKKVGKDQVGQESAEEYVQEDTGIREVIFYQHKDANTVLNVIESTYPIATASVFKFHTTFVMNYITHNAIVSGYPNMTTKRVGLVNSYIDSFPLRIVRCLIKYAGRGFKIIDRAYDWKHEEHDCKTYGYCGRAARKVSDQYTMRFSFAEEIGTEIDVIESRLAWRLGSMYNCRPQKGRRMVPGQVVIPGGH